MNENIISVYVGTSKLIGYYLLFLCHFLSLYLSLSLTPHLKRKTKRKKNFSLRAVENEISNLSLSKTKPAKIYQIHIFQCVIKKENVGKCWKMYERKASKTKKKLFYQLSSCFLLARFNAEIILHTSSIK